jgi:hypothetical protein
MFELFKVTSWASARAGCPMQHRVDGSDEVEFTFGQGSGSFDFIFDAGALRTFIGLAAEALAEMDARHVQEQAEETMNSGELANAKA